MNIVKNDLFDYENRYIYQVEDGFKFSIDSLLLAEYVKLSNNQGNVVEFCSGLCPVPLVLSTKYSNIITAFEIQKEVYDIASMSVELNSLSDQIKLINDDIKNIGNYFKSNNLDVIICNPPYFKVDESSYISDIYQERISRHEFLISLEDIFSISKLYLKDKGVLYLVHRSNRVDEIILLASKYNLNVKEIVFINTNNVSSKTVLVKCVRNSKMGVNVLMKNVSNVLTYKGIFDEV